MILLLHMINLLVSLLLFITLLLTNRSQSGESSHSSTASPTKAVRQEGVPFPVLVLAWIGMNFSVGLAFGEADSTVWFILIPFVIGGPVVLWLELAVEKRWAQYVSESQSLVSFIEYLFNHGHTTDVQRFVADLLEDSMSGDDDAREAIAILSAREDALGEYVREQARVSRGINLDRTEQS